LLGGKNAAPLHEISQITQVSLFLFDRLCQHCYALVSPSRHLPGAEPIRQNHVGDFMRQHGMHQIRSIAPQVHTTARYLPAADPGL
jgi:hypothetical protein